MNTIATPNTFTNLQQIKTFLFLSVLFFATTITNPLFAQEKVIESVEAILTEQVDVLSEESRFEKVQPIEESAPAESELSKEQMKDIAKLDRLLKQGKITQEEYDTQLADITGIKPVEEEALAARSSAQVEPESQTLENILLQRFPRLMDH